MINTTIGSPSWIIVAATPRSAASWSRSVAANG